MNHNTKKALTLLGIVNDINIDAGVYAVKKKSLVDFTAFSHTLFLSLSNAILESKYLRKTTPITKLPSYVLGFVLILIVVAVMAATILFKSFTLLLTKKISMDPRGICTCSVINLPLFKNFFISRMVYKKVIGKGYSQLLSVLFHDGLSNFKAQCA